MMPNSEPQALSYALSERMGVDYSDTFPRILESLLDPREMELLLATPGLAEDIARNIACEEVEVAEGLYDLYMRGLVYVTDRDDGAPVWGLIDAGRFMDCVLWDPRYDRYGDEFFDLWRQFFNQEMVVNDPPQESLRVLPVEEVIRSTRILDVESAHAIVEGARRIAVQR